MKHALIMWIKDAEGAGNFNLRKNTMRREQGALTCGKTQCGGSRGLQTPE
jgi:hypothetical protein